MTAWTVQVSPFGTVLGPQCSSDMFPQSQLPGLGRSPTGTGTPTLWFLCGKCSSSGWPLPLSLLMWKQPPVLGGTEFPRRDSSTYAKHAGGGTTDWTFPEILNVYIPAWDPLARNCSCIIIRQRLGTLLCLGKLLRSPLKPWVDECLHL